MSILIVEKEAVSRVALQQFLNKDGHKVVHSAKNDLEATNLIATRKSQIRFVIADHEILSAPGSQFLKKISASSVMDFCPVILTSSHLKKSALIEFRKLNPRIDFHLPKPFRASKLIGAMHEAGVLRFSLRNQLIVWTSESGFNSFRRRYAGHFSEMNLIHVKTIPEITLAVSANRFKIGAILIDPDHYQNLMKGSDSKREWLRSFKMTTFGALTRIICLGDQPGIPGALRKYCDIFSSADPKSTTRNDVFFEQIQLKISYGWFLKKIHEKCRSSFQNKNYREAQANVNKMLSIDPYNADAYAFLGRLYETQEHQAKAIKAYEKANAINPFSPEPYLGLMRIAESGTWAEKSILFCPEHPDVLRAAATSWKAAGEQERAVFISNKIAALGNRAKARV